ncbi:MAG: phospho-sugar mutase [Planctomycetaceae bacterium]
MDDPTDHRLAAVDAAHEANELTEHSARTIRDWLLLPRYVEFAAPLAERIDECAAGRLRWKELDDVFWTIIPFGTGGRRGRMYPVGSNAINDRTIGESAQGLADAIHGICPPGDTPSCTIAYDTRHRSEHFARLCAEVLIAAGFRVFFLRGFRSTPELSFAVRFTGSTCGIMVTASHNPPSDNAVKVYQTGGVQVLPPYDREIIDRVMQVDAVRRDSFDRGVSDGRITFVEESVDPAFVAAVLQQASPGPRDLSILYTPLHGVGATAVVPVLRGAGFGSLRLYGPQEPPDGDFPNVPGHVANPENPAVLAGAIAEAKQRGDDLVLASDPDCDRLGAAAPLVRSPNAEWRSFTGTQIAALLCRHVLASRADGKGLRPSDRVVTTMVTSGLVRRIAEAAGVGVIDSLQVGFKWIGRTIDEIGPEYFLYGCEESHGYLAGTHVRDKDAAVAALLFAEMAAVQRAAGRSLHEHLDDLYRLHGFHAERQVSVTLAGAAGMERMREIMSSLRSRPPSAIGGLRVRRIRDLESLVFTEPGRTPRHFPGTAGDGVICDLEGLETLVPASDGELAMGRFEPLSNAVAARPSGTEPKIKFYLFAVAPPCVAEELDQSKRRMADRLDALEHDLRAKVGV